MAHYRRHPVRINPQLIAAARSSFIPRYQQALAAGFNHVSNLSHLIHSSAVIGNTPLMRSRLERLAALLKFPTDQIFVEPEREVEQ